MSNPALSDAEENALRRMRLKFMALYYQMRESPTRTDEEMLELRVTRDALAAYGNKEPSEQLELTPSFDGPWVER